MKVLYLFPVAVFIGCGLTLNSCAPVFSEMQSARTVGKNNLELTSYLTHTSVSQGGQTQMFQQNFGFQTAYGFTDRFDIRLRYEYLSLIKNEPSSKANVLALTPKYSLIQNKFAVTLGVGRAFGERLGNTWQMQPTLLLTIPVVKDKLEINFSPKYLITFCSEYDDYVATNIGLGISNNLKKWAIRPEYEVLLDPGRSSYYGQFSIGFSWIL